MKPDWAERLQRTFRRRYEQGRHDERTEILEGLWRVGHLVLKPSEFRDGYLAAMRDIHDQALPNNERFDQ